MRKRTGVGLPVLLSLIRTWTVSIGEVVLGSWGYDTKTRRDRAGGAVPAGWSCFRWPTVLRVSTQLEGLEDELAHRYRQQAAGSTSSQLQQIRESIARGELLPETALPSVRQLSRELVVNPNTVARAYTELEREGLLVSRPGRGIYVAQPRNDLTQTARDRRLGEQLDRWLTEAVHLGYSPGEVLRLVAQRVGQFQWNADRAA